MSTTWLIARRELLAYLRTTSGYLIVAGVLLIAGLFFNVLALKDAVRRSSEVLQQFFYFMSGMTMACGVLLSMRLIAEERQNKTLVLLYSSPVKDVHIVMGKYLSALLFFALFLATTFYMPLWVYVYGKVSWGQLFVGYTGLLLLGSACIAIGTFASSLTQSQLLSAFIATILVVVLVVSWMIAGVTERPLNDFFQSLSMYGHFKPFETGIFHLNHAFYFMTVTFVSLFLATRVLEARRWSA